MLLSKIESVGLRKASDRQYVCKCYNVYISLPYIVAARTAGIVRNEEITLLSPCVFLLW